MSNTNETNAPAAQQPAWFPFLRILLGLILLWKGITFIRDTVHLKTLIQQTEIGTFSQSADTLTMVVAILTLACGLFITVGLFTRIAAIIQIPIVLVAILFVNIRNIDQSGFELFLSIVVLLLLILFAVKGSAGLGAKFFRNTSRV